MRRLVAALLAVLASGVLIGIVHAYQHPDLRKAVVFSGFGLC